MSAYEFFKDFAGPIATGTAALTAASITAVFAYRQSKTAELQAQIALDKLKHDTFDKRIDVLNACYDLVGLLENKDFDKEIEAQDYLACILRMRQGTYYFCDDINDLIEQATSNTPWILAFRNEMHLIKTGSKERENRTAWLSSQLAGLSNKIVEIRYAIEEDLTLNFLKRGSEQGRRRLLAERAKRQASRVAKPKWWQRLSSLFSN